MDRLRPSPPAARRAAVAGVLAVAVASVVPARAVAGQGAPTAADARLARELHAKGKQAYQAGDMRAAYEAYSAAWALTKTFDIAANLGAVELATARFRDAAEHLAFALANLPVSGDDKQRTALTKLLDDAKKQIGVLTIKASVDGAAITLDGRPLGSSPLPNEIFVDAGDHVIGATAPTFAPAEQKITVAKGASFPVVITLKTAEVATPPPVAPPPSGPSPITVAGFVTAGLGFGIGTALAIVSKIKADDASAQLDALRGKGANACAGASPSSACVALHDARAGRDTFANGAFWTFIGAGAVTAGTLIYTFAVPRSPAPKATGVSAVPVVAPGGAGLLVRGAF